MSDEAISLFNRGLLRILDARNDMILLFLLSSFLISCSPTQSNTQTQIVTISYSPFTEFQMDEVYACANDLSIILKISEENPGLYFQIGEPEILFDQAYQIGEEEIIVVVNQQSQIQNLSQADVQNLFANQTIQVWVYAEGEDMQKLFDQFVMEGRSVSAFAKVAANPKIMIEALKSESNAIGFIPQSFMDENLRQVYSAGKFPVLAITNSEPQGAVKSLIGCLQ